MLTDQLGMFQEMGNRIARLEKAVNLPPNVDLKDEVASEDDVSVSPREERRMHGPSDDASSDHTHRPTYDITDEDVEKEPGPPLPPGQPSIPTDHTTGAGHLLSWPCINDMLREALGKEDIKHLSEFPIQIEERRGTLRVYGRGEGREEREPRDPALRDRDSQTVHGSAEIPDDLYPDLNSPTPGDSSGYIGGFSPGSVNDNATSSPRPPPLNQSGIPDFSEKNIMKLLRSFQDNILIMHPIILPRTLRQMVEKFLDSIPKPTKAFNPASTASFVSPSHQPSAFETAGTKRKRSPGAEMPDTPQFQHRIGRPTRTINNAVVLAMLALGKVCLKRDVVPDVVHDDERVGNDSPNSPNASSPECTPSAPYPSTMMSPKTSDRPARGRRPSVQGNGIVPQTRRNYDVIPGLEYFAIATDIIGNEIGGNSLNHVYASIFAGLYHGQLGRVIESHAYIGQGCAVLWNIIRP